jgi:hypothetical protein
LPWPRRCPRLPVRALRAMPSSPSASRPYVAPFVATGNITGVVLVARQGKVVFRRAYGMAPNAEAVVTAGPGYLLLEVGTLRTPLVPTASNDLLERTSFGHVSPSRGADGRVTGLTYRLGKDFVARRAE